VTDTRYGNASATATPSIATAKGLMHARAGDARRQFAARQHAYECAAGAGQAEHQRYQKVKHGRG
jgi:hypothetical protein